MNIKKPIKSILLLFGLVFGISILAFASTPPTNLTLLVAPVVLPSGVTLEWHNALPISPSTPVPDPTAVSPGIYYAIYNLGNGCYSRPTPIKVVTNVCPKTTVDLSESVDTTLNKPYNTVVSYHSALPASLANKISDAVATKAVPGKYFVTYYDASSACFTPANIIIFVGTVCPAKATNLSALINNTPLPLGAVIQWKDSSGNSVSDPLNVNPGLYSALYDFGSGCLSSPTKIRITTNICPSLTANITAFVDSANKPANTIVTYHRSLPPTNANKLTLAQAMAADSGTYYAAYYDMNGLCYTNSSAIVVAFTGCLSTLALSNVDFSVKSNNCNVKLNWKVDDQSNLGYYGVMRKAKNETNFTEITKIVVDKNKTLPAQYSYEFQNLEPQYYSFKIKWVDDKSNINYSKTIATKLSCETYSISVYPNPVNQILNIKINNLKPQLFEIIIIDNLGRTIIKDKLNIIQPTIDLKYDLSKYANGLYNVIVINDNKRKSFKVLKIN